MPFNKSSISMSFFSTKDLALFKILISKPSFLLIEKALLLPGIPISNLYVGLRVSILNSKLAFSNPLLANAYSFNSW